MTANPELIEDARALRERFVGGSGYGLVYGSHGSGKAHANSDLDLVLISESRLSATETAELVEQVCRSHQRHGLDLDVEVAHEVKLHATADDVADALSLSCFPLSEGGDPMVSVVPADPIFLNSDEFRLRLLLNALSSPHVFIGGHEPTYRAHRRRAEEALGLLALSMLDLPVLTVPQAADVLLAAPDGARGEDFLGYQDVGHLLASLRRGFTALGLAGVVEIEGDGVLQDRRRRRSVLALQGRR